MPFLVLLILLFLPVSLHAEIRAWVDQNPVIAGDGFQLHVESDGSWNSDELDRSPLRDFSIVNQSAQSQTSIVNTTISRKTQWTFVLIARKAGQYRIPEFRLGGSASEVLELKVLPQGTGSQQGKMPDLYLESTLESKEVYIQQQILYTLKIFRSLQVQGESIGKFVVDNAIVEQLSQSSGTEIIQGKRYQVTQIKFAIFPQKSGILNIPAIQYQGDVIVSNRNRFGFGNFFNNRGQRIQRESSAYEVNVLPKPASMKNWWLPAMGVQLMEEWQPNPPVFRVGEPVTRIFTVTAVGVSGTQLPELEVGLPEGMKNYADRPVLESSKSAQGVIGSRKETHALIPSRPGEFVLPAIRLQWWHIPSGQIKEATIPEQVIQVQPAILADAPTSVSPAAPETQQSESSASMNVPASSLITPIANPLWQYASFVLGALWVLTLGLWYWQSSKHKRLSDPAETPDPTAIKLKDALLQLRLACKQHDAIQTKAALLQWGRVAWSDSPPRNLEQITQRLPELKEGIADLHDVLYHASAKTWDSQKFQNAFDQVNLVPDSQKQSSNALPPLWS